MRNRRSQQKEHELLDALRFDPAHLWPALRALRGVMGAPALSDWVRRHGAAASTSYLSDRTRPTREEPDGSGPIPSPPAPGRRADAA